MATQLGQGHIVGLSGATLGQANLSGYVAPNIQSLRMTHNAEPDRIKSQAGEYTSVVHMGDFLECEFSIIPEGSTVANAVKSAGLPLAGQAFTITGLPIIATGPFVDALNTNGSNTQPWFYEGGGSYNGTNTEKWSMSIPLRRYIGITSAAAVT